MGTVLEEGKGHWNRNSTIGTGGIVRDKGRGIVTGTVTRTSNRYRDSETGTLEYEQHNRDR